MTVEIGLSRRSRIRRVLNTPKLPPSGLSAFAPSFQLPADLRGKVIRENITNTARAVEHIATQEGVTKNEAAVRLRDIQDKIQRRDEILASAEAGIRGHALAEAAMNRAGIPKALRKKETTQYNLPEGHFESSGLPGGDRTVRRLPDRVPPRPVPEKPSWLDKITMTEPSTPTYTPPARHTPLGTPTRPRATPAPTTPTRPAKRSADRIRKALRSLY